MCGISNDGISNLGSSNIEAAGVTALALALGAWGTSGITTFPYSGGIDGASLTAPPGEGPSLVKRAALLCASHRQERPQCYIRNITSLIVHCNRVYCDAQKIDYQAIRSSPWRPLGTFR